MVGLVVAVDAFGVLGVPPAVSETDRVDKQDEESEGDDEEDDAFSVVVWLCCFLSARSFSCFLRSFTSKTEIVSYKHVEKSEDKERTGR